MQSINKRLAALLLALLMLLSGLTAIAEQAMVMRETTVYTAARTTAGTLPAGTMLETVAVQNGWALVRMGGNSGVVRSEDLGAVRLLNGATAYAACDAPLYDSFLENAKPVCTLPSGTAVAVGATAGDWALVRSGSRIGFMSVSALTPDAPAKSETAPMSVTAYAKLDGAKVCGADGKVVGTVSVNTAVTIKAVRNGVCLVERDGATAFMLLSELSPSKVVVQQPAQSDITSIEPTTFYVKLNGAKVYGSNGKVINTLALNTAVTVTAYNKSLALISVNGSQGLMYRSDLSTVKTEQTGSSITIIAPTTFYVKNDGAKVYSSSGKPVGTLGINTAVTVTAYNDSLAMISGGGNQGLMYRSDLSAERIPVAEPTQQPQSSITEIAPTTFYVKNDGAKVLSASGECIATLSLNAAVVVNAYSGELARVVSGSAVGFMRKIDLSTEKTPTQSSFVLQYGDTGEAVKSLQARLKELGYFTGTVGGNYLDLTRAAVSAFQTVAKMTATGIADQATLAAIFSDSAPEAPKPEAADDGVSTVKPATGTAREMDWWTSDISSIFSVGTIATVTDVNSGIAWLEKRTGGTNHADVQPATAADTAAMKKAVGSWSWTRRPIFVTINGVNYAASMNCMPHGFDSISSNNFDGHHCIHFTNSRTHGSNKVCSLHQAAIRKAAAAAL